MLSERIKEVSNSTTPTSGLIQSVAHSFHSHDKDKWCGIEEQSTCFTTAIATIDLHAFDLFIGI